MEVVFACDIDKECRRAYRENFGLEPARDVAAIKSSSVPDHDILMAGFPCQPFSIIGRKQGFSDPRGTLIFEAFRIIKKKRPSGVILENVKQIVTHNKGREFRRILSDLEDLGYCVSYKILNARDFGLPQKRERVIIVGALNPFKSFPWPLKPIPMTPLTEILESDPDPKHYVSETIRRKRRQRHTASIAPAVWHENKAGNISSHPWSCALRAGASYNYLLVDGERRLTPRETLRLQGFPDTWKIVCSDAQTRKQTGNAVPVPLVQAVLEQVENVIAENSFAWQKAAS